MINEKEFNEFEKTTENEIKLLDRRISVFNKVGWSLVILGLVIGVIGIGFQYIDNSYELKLNEIGDFVGGTVASLWALSGLFFIYVAFLGQQKQMILQRLELQYNRFEIQSTRLELEGQKDQMIQQNASINKQIFENTFFKLLDLHHQIVNSIDYDTYSDERYIQGSQWLPVDGRPDPELVVIKSRDVFKYLYEILMDRIKNSRKGYLEAYMTLWNEVQTDFGHYFRNLYRIIKLVDNASFTDQTGKKFSQDEESKNDDFDIKYEYTALLRAQLSEHELLWLFYNCLSENGVDKFKPLVEKYSMLKNMPLKKVHNENLINEFDLKAFNKGKSLPGNKVQTDSASSNDTASK